MNKQALQIDRSKFYVLWDLHPDGKTWMIDRTYSGAYFVEGSYGHRFLNSPVHRVTLKEH